MLLRSLSSMFASDYQISSERLFGVHSVPKKLNDTEKRLKVKSKKRNKISQQSRKRNRK